MGRISQRRFSLPWVLVSYFMICGGIVAAIVAVVSGFRAADMDPRVAGYLACGGGGALGGLFAGRASNHFSVLEPALAGAMVIASIFALIRYTAIGPLAFAFAEEAIIRESLVLGGLAFGGGLVGAVVGEITAPGAPSRHPLRWLGMSVFLTAGALLFTTVLTHALLADRTLRDPMLFSKLWNESPVITQDQLVAAALISLAGAALLGGFITQMAAPCRMLLASAAGAFVAIAGALFGLFALGRVPYGDAVIAALAMGAGAFVLSFVGALIGWVPRRLFGEDTTEMVA
jgi:hypothetical protein